jgi:hypothetical protein
VAQCAFAQVGVDGVQICLEELSGGVDGLVIRLALNCWYYWVSKARHDVLDGGVLHLDVLGEPECLFDLLVKKRFWSGGQRKRESCLRDIALGSNVLVMSNELHLG